MKNFAVINQSGEPVFTFSPADDGQYEDGQAYGENMTVREFPLEIPHDVALNTFYWKGEWGVRAARPGDYYQWDPVTEDWVGDIAGAKRAAIERANLERAARLQSGVQFEGHLFDSDATAMANVAEALNMLNAGMTVPEGFTWRTKENVNIPFTAAEIQGLATAMFMRKNAIYQASWAIKAEIEAMTTVAAVEAKDLSVGWPE